MPVTGCVDVIILTTMKTAVTVLVLCFLAYVHAHSSYQWDIPNGHNVPDPCRSGHVWHAVGHFNPSSGNSHNTNQFAKDFRTAGHRWTAWLCGQDSDGDGKTNGEELGDQGCTWTHGSSPSSHATGHPGICEPGSARCATGHYDCNCHGPHCMVGK